MDSRIEDVQIRKILDSRGNPTVEVDVLTWNGFGRATVPNGSYNNQIVTFPDGGVNQVLSEIEDIVSSEIMGIDADDIEGIDDILKEIDGTNDFSSLGGNTTLAVSLACAKAAADSYNLPLYKYLAGSFVNELPFPIGNMIDGGNAKTLNIHEFLAIPIGAPNFIEAVFANVLVYNKINELIKVKDKTFTGGKGDKGGYVPNIFDDEALEILSQACEDATDEIGFNIKLGLDFKASKFWDSKNEVFCYQNSINRDCADQLEYVKDIIETYDMFYIEDPFDRNDFDSFSQLTIKTKDKCLICGDDLFVTNKQRLSKGIDINATNAIIIKPNQTGSLTETYQTVKLAKKNNIIPIISQRSGETTDNVISHLAVGFESPMIKTGVIGGERIAKLNELIRIEEELLNPKMAEF